MGKELQRIFGIPLESPWTEAGMCMWRIMRTTASARSQFPNNPAQIAKPIEKSPRATHLSGEESRMGSGMCRRVPALLGLCRSRGSKNAHDGILRLRGLL